MKADSRQPRRPSDCWHDPVEKLQVPATDAPHD